MTEIFWAEDLNFDCAQAECDQVAQTFTTTDVRFSWGFRPATFSGP